MKKRYGLSLLFLISAFILELLPYGAVLQFAVAPEEGGGTLRRTFSYFDLTPFGYANFPPFLTASLTVLLLALCLVLIIGKGEHTGLRRALFIGNAVALVLSLLPLLFSGFYLFSVTGGDPSIFVEARVQSPGG